MLSQILNRNMKKTGGVKNYMTPYIDRIISLFHKLEESASNDCYEALIRLEFPKGSYLVREGSVPRYIWFIQEGLARRFINKDGVEVTQHFFCAGEFVFLYENAVFVTPTAQNIQFLEDSVVYAVRWDILESMKTKYPLINQIEIVILASYVGWLEKKMNLCQHASAKKRYQYLMEMQPHLVDMVPHHYIASYLDITRETLSRIRAEYKNELQFKC